MLQATDLGEGKVGQVLEGVLRIQNSGSEPLTYKVETSCLCAYVHPSNGTLDPGDAELIRVGLQLRYQGKDENATVRIYSNDPDTPVGEHFLFAKCPAPLLVVPRAIDFGDVVEASCPSKVLEAFESTGKAFVTSSGVRVSCSSPYLTVSQEEGEQQQLLVRVTLKSTAPRGHFKGEIEFRLPDEDGLNVLVTGQVRGPVCVSPCTVFLWRDPKTRLLREAKFLVWRSDGTPLGKLVHVNGPEG